VSILSQLDVYRYWRDEKLENALTSIEQCLVPIADPYKLTGNENEKISELCLLSNFALIQLANQNNYTNSVLSLNRQLGLTDYDKHLYAQGNGLSEITQSNNTDQAEFIPYTNKNIGWHTDGYYNPIQQTVRSMTLFCINKAKSGGENTWIDHQMAYILLREDNPDIVNALLHPEAMTIPQHEVNGNVRRPKSTGPIFFIDKKSEQLSMRYTQRKKNVQIFNSAEIRQAIEGLDGLLSSNTQYHFKLLFEPGQGIICNNIIHKREKFIDNPTSPRLLLRGRYYNHI
jgi:alpha-ketoglutarate-dependent taurine dioxygenase